MTLQMNGAAQPKSRVSTPKPRPQGKLPGLVSGAYPLIGHGIEFATNCLPLLWRGYQEQGELATLRVFNKNIVLFTGPEAQEAMYRQSDEVLSPNETYEIMTPVFGKDVVYDASPERMGEQLAILRPALQDKRMRTYGEIVAKETRKALAQWGDKGEMDLVEFCAMLTNYTSTHCLIGREFRERMSDEFSKVYYDLERGITPASYIHANLPLPSMIRRDRARERLMAMIGEIVDERQKSGAEGEDFLQTLMDARYKDGSSLTRHEITGMLLAAMFAGHHTSSVTVAWTLIELIKTPDYQDRLLEELERVYGSGGDVTFQSLRQIPLTEYAVKEALRKHPPLWILMRAVMSTFEYGGYTFEKGTWIANSPWVSHRLPHVFSNPEAFDPDRFAPGREEDKKQFTFVSFGGGRHKCLGNAFALLQVKTIFAIMMRGFTFELGHNPLVPESGLVMGPKKPFKVRYQRIRPNGAF